MPLPGAGSRVRKEKEEIAVTTKKHKAAWLLPTVLILFICEVLTLPLILVLTYAGRSAAPDHVLSFKDGQLAWLTAENVLEDGSAEFRLFSDQYQSVKSENGDKVVAPGTENDSLVRLKNESEQPITYIATLYAIHWDSEVPVQAQLVCGDGVETDRAVLPPQVTSAQVLGSYIGEVKAAEIADFTTEWTWLFEESDAQDQIDTQLGNRAADGQLDRITLGLYIVVESDGDIYPPIPPTGYNTAFLTALTLCAVSALLLIILVGKRRKDDEEEKG